MRLSISFFVLLMLTLTQWASADFTVANDSNTTVKVIYGYFDPSEDAFRIKGYYHINPGKSQRLKVPAAVDTVFARIWTASEVVFHDRPSGWTWAVHPRRAFEVVYKHKERIVLQSNVPREELVSFDDFYEYANNTTFTYQPGNGSVNIPDRSLSDAIARALGKTRNAKITPADMLRLQTLEVDTINDAHILTGLEFATNLTWLYLRANNISDISPLANLRNLTSLYLRSNNISDISPLAKLTKLTRLSLGYNNISNISPLANLTKLTFLDLRANNTPDVSPLANLRNLTSLSVGANNISDVSPLANLTKLTSLDIWMGNISDVSPLANLRNLTRLHLGNNNISDVSPLANLTKLTELFLSNNKISDFSQLARVIPNLTSYSKDNQDVPADDAMAEEVPVEEESDAGDDLRDGTDGTFGDTVINIPDPNLRSNIALRLDKRQGETIRASDMLALTRLQFHALEKKNGLQNIKGLEFATNLTELTLLSGTVSDVSPLTHLRKLRVLKIEDHQISDISPLAGLTNLTQLDLSHNEISDISPLAGLTNLTQLDLASNKITDFSPIAGLIPNLTNYDNSNQRGLDTAVNIPDPNLRTVIEKRLGKASGATITRADMLKLTELRAEERGVQDLTGLEFAKNLTELRLWRNRISDISSLAGLTELTVLDLDGTEIVDISSLAGLTELAHLNLWGNQITDISPVAGLTQLTYLDLDGNEIVDISSLARLTNLTDLRLHHNEIVDLSPLAGLTELTELSLWRNRISDISLLAKFTKLTQLSLSGNQITDISPLAGLTNLTELWLNDNRILDFSPIAGLIPNLTDYSNRDQRGLDTPVNIPDSKLRLSIEKALSKSSGALITWADMLKLTELNPVALGVQKLGKRFGIKDLTGLEFATNLKKLTLNGTEIMDLSPLAGLKQLEWLFLGRNRITNISPLAGLTKLEKLLLGSNFISDVSPLANLKNLQDLRLSYNGLSDLSPLAGLTSLRRLWLKNNLISDVSPLARLTKLTLLDLWGNRISDFSPIAGIVRNIDPKWYDFFAGGQTLPGGGCRTQMSDDLEPLSPVRVKPRIERKTMSSEVGASHSVVKASVYSDDWGNRLWTPADTVASDEEEVYSLVLTVEFLDGWKFERERRMVEDAAVAWALSGNMLMKFVSSGESDIRVKFDDEKRDYWKSNIGAPPGLNREKHWNSDEHTMYLTTDVSYGTALHEFGHALGLIHEHLNPEFLKHFAWKFAGEQLYLEISKHFKKHFSVPPTEKDKQAIDKSFLKLREVDEEKSVFDVRSVMTYGLPNKFIEIRPSADQSIKDAFVRNEGIPENNSLSSGDREFITQWYGDPIARAKISGTIRVDGLDKEISGNHDTIDKTQTIPPHIVGHHPVFYGRTDKAFEFKWGGECRVEVYLTTRKIENREVEVGVAALLYEGSVLDGGENTDDLEDIRCRSFTVPVDGTGGVKISLKNVSWGPRDIDAREIECTELNISFKEGGMRGDLIGGGGDWADVYVTVNASYVGTTFAAAAPSMIIASDTSASETAGQILTSDVNGDGRINAADLVLVSNHLGQTGSIDPRVDVNSDGIVTIADLIQVARYLGQSTYASAPSPVVVPAGLEYATVKGWIDQASVEDDGSLVFRQGIAKLEYLLTLIIPEKTALLPNYPNPFNPETWIPYHLAEPADVTLTIYAIDGRVVRHLDLGHQAAGYYQSKARAAYWDGRNAVGERVASGIYFYTLTAGDFSATRKLLIRK